MNKKTLKLFITSLPILSLGHVALAGSVGNDFQKLSPIGSSIDYTVIEPSATIKSGKLNSGILVDYSTNVLPVIESDQELQSIGSINDSILSSHIFASYGLMKILKSAFICQRSLLTAQTLMHTKVIFSLADSATLERLLNIKFGQIRNMA